jgi:hypothetical protein
LDTNLLVPSLADYRVRFFDLSPSRSQLGLDEVAADRSEFLYRWHEEAEAVSSAADARQLLRRGATPADRPRLWRLALGLDDDDSDDGSEARHFSELRQLCDRLDLLTDELYMFDVQTVTDNPCYFVFEVSHVTAAAYLYSVYVSYYS